MVACLVRLVLKCRPSPASDVIALHLSALGGYIQFGSSITPTSEASLISLGWSLGNFVSVPTWTGGGLLL